MGATAILEVMVVLSRSLSDYSVSPYPPGTYSGGIYSPKPHEALDTLAPYPPDTLIINHDRYRRRHDIAEQLDRRDILALTLWWEGKAEVRNFV